MKVIENQIITGKVILALVPSIILILSSVLIFTQPALANDPGGDQMEKVIDGTKVTLAFDHGHAAKGANGLKVSLHDSKGTAIEKALVKVTVRMDPAANMNSHAMLNLDPRTVEMSGGMAKGEYGGKVDFTDAGMWLVTPSFDLLGKESEVTFDVEVVGGGPNWLILGGLTGLIVLAIVGAGIMKRKKALATQEAGLS